MIKLAITGGIGSGKSHVARQMSELLGIPVYDSDSNAKRLN
jgi:dephospho-CoA kinase